MIVKTKNLRCGADPVMSQAGAVPGPNASMKMGPPSATSGHPRSRYVNVRQRRRFKEHRNHKNPDQQMKSNEKSCLNILQINIEGIKEKKTELANLMSEKNIHVALVQESLHFNTDPHITYTHTPFVITQANNAGVSPPT